MATRPACCAARCRSLAPTAQDQPERPDRRQQNERERAVEPERTGYELAGARRPRLRWLANVVSKVRDNGTHLRDADVWPRATEDPAGKFAGQPHNGSEEDEYAEQP